MTLTVRIVWPASREKEDMLQQRVADLEAAGLRVQTAEIGRDPDWPHVAGSVQDRLSALTEALTDEQVDAVLCARGGYGASDLLEHLPWDRLQTAPFKWVIGFSDIAALHSAFLTQLGWSGLQAPMPLTGLWREGSDAKALAGLLQKSLNDGQISGEIAVDRHGSGKADESIVGTLFGGCFSVLTGLIGTPYMPKSLAGHILFLEDVDEHPARLMRSWNQWLQAGLLRGVKAVVLGNFLGPGDGLADNDPLIYGQFAARTEVPLFVSKDFGHIEGHRAIVVGADATISVAERKLVWTHGSRHTGMG